METKNVEGNSNDELKEIVANLIREVFRHDLSLLEIVYPHQKGDNSENEKSFNTLRGRILRSGNDAVRELDHVFDSFVSFKANSYVKTTSPGIETIIISFKEKYLVNPRGGK